MRPNSSATSRGMAHATCWAEQNRHETDAAIRRVGSSDETVGAPQVIVVQNWIEELRRMMPTN